MIRKSIRTCGVFVVLAALTIAFCSRKASAQATDGNIVGAVVDPQGAAVVGAQVSATNVETNTTAVTKTNEAGEYRIDHLLVGTYRVTAKMEGFKTTAELSEVHLNTTGTVNLTLATGAVSETVEVSGQAQIMDTKTAQLQTTYEDKKIEG